MGRNKRAIGKLQELIRIRDEGSLITCNFSVGKVTGIVLDHDWNWYCHRFGHGNH